MLRYYHYHIPTDKSQMMDQITTLDKKNYWLKIEHESYDPDKVLRIPISDYIIRGDLVDRNKFPVSRIIKIVKQIIDMERIKLNKI